MGLLLAMPSWWVTGVVPLPAAGHHEYADHHLIVRFRPGVSIPPYPRVFVQQIPSGNKVLDELKAHGALTEVARLTPDLPPSADRIELARPPMAQRAPQSLQEVAALFRHYGQDRSVLLRFARSIDPHRLAEQLMRRYPDLIEFAEPDYIEPVTAVPNDPRFRSQWYLWHRVLDPQRRADIRVVEAWDIATGSPDVVIAVIDAGVDAEHPDLVNNIFVHPDEIPNNMIDEDSNGFVDDVSGWDFTHWDNEPDDETGHGTWMSGVAAAATNNLRDVAGVSWSSRILPLKAGDASGIYVSAQIQAINYAIALAPRGVRVINMSFGGASPSREREMALRAANDARIIVIAAAGNGGPDAIGDNNDLTPFYPASFSQTLDNVVAVAATDGANQLSSFSNFGWESVDVAAPGENIFSLTSRDASLRLGSPSGLTVGHGTSPATAIVSGLAALIYSAFPDITPLEVKRRLRGGVDRVGSLLERTASGGRVNAFRALERDDISPAPITDLRAASDASPVTLTWTATGDDHQRGQATSYEIRYLTTPMTPENIRQAHQLTNVPFPQPAGTTETVVLPEALPPGLYYVVIRVLDNVGNVTESNQVAVMAPG
jgi:subtilisin family serine protease